MTRIYFSSTHWIDVPEALEAVAYTVMYAIERNEPIISVGGVYFNARRVRVISTTPSPSADDEAKMRKFVDGLNGTPTWGAHG